MPIFNTTKLPIAPEFQIGPESHDHNHVTSENDSSSMNSSSASSTFRSLSRVNTLTNRMSSMLSQKKAQSSSNFSSSRMKRIGSNVSLGSSHSKHTAFRLAEQHRSLYFFTPSNPLRRVLIKITESQVFDMFIVAVIFLNCISLAMTNPKNSPTLDNVLDIFEWIFTGIFLVELIMKVIALGFMMHPGSYMRNPWNVLDFCIVSLSFLQVLPGVNNYSAVRSLRALRPLRTIHGIPGLRVIVNALLQSIPPFINVLVLLFFSFGIFGILGVQLWRGVFRNRCVISDSSYLDDDGVKLWRLAYDDQGEEILCSLFWLGRSCPNTYFGEPVHCQADGSPQNPLSGLINYDHIGWAFMQVFQIYAGEEWTLSMYCAMDAWSYLAVFYYLVVTFFGALFAVNLGLAVINDRFNHVSVQAENDTASQSIRTRFYNLLQSRKESMWVINKLRWLDYQSDDDDNSSEATIQTAGEMSGPEAHSDVNEALPSPRFITTKSKSQLRINAKTKHDSPIHQNTMGHEYDSSHDNSSSSGEEYEDPFAITHAKSETPIEFDSDSDSSAIPQQQTNALPKQKINRKTMKKSSLSLKRIASMSTMRTRPKGFVPGCLYLILRTQRRIRRQVNHLVKNEWFSRFMLGIIALNTVFLAVEHYQQPDWLTLTTDIANYVFIAIFTIELLLKLYGLGISFFRDFFNFLDLIVVLASFLELIFVNVSSFAVLRTFRLLRVFKLLSWKSLRKLTTTILGSIKSIYYLSIIFTLFVFIMTLIGMQSFAGRLDSLGPPVQNFDDFIHAMITVFQIITKENWVYVYANLMEAQAGNTIQQLTTIFFMVATIILGDFILLNLFLAILLQSFDNDAEELMDSKRKSMRKKLSDKQMRPNSVTHVQSFGDVQSHGSASASESGPSQVAPETANAFHHRFSGFFISRWRQWQEVRRKRKDSNDDPNNHLTMASGTESGDSRVDEEKRSHSSHTHTDVASVRSIDSESDVEGKVLRDPMPLQGRSLFIFPPTFKLRIFLKRVITHPITELFLLVCVIISSLMLAVETPDIDPNSVLGQIVFWLGVFFATIFTVEMLIKWFVQGIIRIQPRKENRVGYFNDQWNVLDAIIVVVSIVTLIYQDSRVTAIKALRALRPLRFVNKVRGLKVVVTTLFRSIKAIVNVLIVCFLVFLIFGILGVEMLGGMMYYCSTEHIGTQQDCLYPSGVNRTMDFAWDSRTSSCSMQPQFEELIVHKDNCTAPMLWKNNKWHFDHLPSALLVLFEVGAIENWPDISEAAVAAVGIDMQPKKDHNIFVALYFVFFVAIGAMFIVNLFVGVVLSSFNRIKEEEDGSLMLTSAQKDWVATQRLFLKLKLTKKSVPPKNCLRKPIHYLVTNTKFDMIISAIIIINIIFMALEHDRMNPTFEMILSIANQIFTAIFTLEAVLKIIGLGILQYFTDAWNLFDLFVVVLSVFGITINYLDAGIGISPTILRVFRVFRIFRILRLVKTTKRIRALLETLYYSVPSMVNVMLTVVLVAFIYAIVGMNLFYYVKPTDELNHIANFQGFLNSMLVMIRISTAEDWNGIMRDCMNQENCVGNECGNPWLAIPFFVSYVILCTFVIMNLFVAVILDNFETQMRFEDSALNSTDLTRFAEIWSDFDPKATYTIRTEYLKNLLQRVGPPLGLPFDCSRAELIRKLVSLDIPEHQGKIHFIETLIPLARRVYDVELPLHERRKLEKNLARRFKSLKKMSSTLGYSTGEYYAATYIQAAFRGRQVRNSGKAVIGLELVRTESGRLRFKIDRRCHRLVKTKELAKREKEEKEGQEGGSETDEDTRKDSDSSTVTTVSGATDAEDSSYEDSYNDEESYIDDSDESDGNQVDERHLHPHRKSSTAHSWSGIPGISTMTTAVGGRVVQLQRNDDDAAEVHAAGAPEEGMHVAVSQENMDVTERNEVVLETMDLVESTAVTPEDAHEEGDSPGNQQRL